MKISEILKHLNTFEKNKFLGVIDQIISEKPKNYKKVDKILREVDGPIKNADNLSVEKVFELVEEEYEKLIKEEFKYATNQLDIIVDILIRDGNSLMSREWLLNLYNKEIKLIKSRAKDLETRIDSEEEDGRSKDYYIYKSCIWTAYFNDEENNQDKKVTDDEQSILNTLTKALDLSHEEVKLINYSVIPINKLDIDELISYLVKVGIIFYSKKNYQVYVPDEIIRVLRRLRGKEVPAKIYKRVLKTLKVSQINRVARKHGIPYNLSRQEKQKQIVSEGIKFSSLLINGIHKSGTTKTDKKKEIIDIIEKGLNISEYIKGASLEDKVANFIDYFNQKEEDENISIAIHGYDRLLKDLNREISKFGKQIRAEFEFEDKEEITAENLLMHSLKPQDVLYILSEAQVKEFCESQNISTRGNEIVNILDSYRDVQNLYLENYIHISNRDVNALRGNQIEIKESEIGNQYEILTKLIFEEMNLNVAEELRSKINTSRDKIDIILKVSESDLIIVECKTKKDRKFSTYSSASRQVKAYKNLVEKAGFNAVKTFIVAPTFSEDFINECGLDYELNLSLITSEALLDMYRAFKKSDLKEFPYKILLRDVLIDSDRVVKSILK